MGKRKILLIDDEVAFTEMLKLNLESDGVYDVIIENNSSKAVDTALAHKPDLIFLDIIMPGMEGPDVAMAIQSNSELRNIPIVFLTATITKEEVDLQDGTIGGQPFVAKPADLPTLRKAIKDNIK